MDLERWLWANADDWLDGKPGAATLRRLSEVGPSAVPEDLLAFLAPELARCPVAELRHEAIQIAGHAVVNVEKMRRVALRVSGVLREADVPHVFVKGSDLRYRLYPDPHRRLSNDIDILCRADRRRTALDSLEVLGADLLDPPDPFLSGMYHELAARIDGIAVDLHTSMLQPGRSAFDPGEVIDRSDDIKIEGGALPVSCREDAIALCLVHIGVHEGAAEYVDFKHGLDVALAVRRWSDLDWRLVAERVGAWRCRRIAGAGLWTWRPLMGVLIPAEAYERLDPGPIPRRLAQRTRQVLSRRRVRARGFLRGRQLIRKLAFAEGWPERRWLLLEFVHRLSGRGR